MFPRGFVLDDVPVLREHAILHAYDVSDDPRRRRSETAEAPMEDDELSSRRRNVVLVAQRCGQGLDQVKQTVTPGRDMCAVLDVTRRPEAFGGGVVTPIEKGIKRVEDDLDLRSSVLGLAGVAKVISPLRGRSCAVASADRLFERCTRQFPGNVPKPRRRCRISRLRHDQRARRCSSQFAKSSGSVIGAWPCLRARRREQDRPGAVRCGMTEEWSREIGCKRNEAARTAREQVGSGKSRMGRVTDQVPARCVAPSLQFKREHQTRELRLSVGLPRRVHPFALQIIEIDAPGSMRQTAEADNSCFACPAQ